MKGKTARSIGKLGLIPSDEPMGDVPDRIKISRAQWEAVDRTGCLVAVPVQTVGPTAKELEHRRLFAEGRTRQTPPRTRTRARGAGRPKGQATRSSAKSGDSGEDGESSEPPPAGRPCECGCGQDVSHRAAQALYLNDQHAAADRQRRKRQRDLTAPALNGDAPKPVRCKCAPKGELVDNNVCVQCGRARGHSWAIDADAPRSRQITIHELTRRNWRTGDGKRRKPDERFDPSIIESGVAA